jgi:hypothetical protein
MSQREGQEAVAATLAHDPPDGIDGGSYIASDKGDAAHDLNGGSVPTVGSAQNSALSVAGRPSKFIGSVDVQITVENAASLGFKYKDW